MAGFRNPLFQSSGHGSAGRSTHVKPENVGSDRDYYREQYGEQGAGPCSPLVFLTASPACRAGLASLPILVAEGRTAH
jgi:hypothetical protein